MLTPSSRPRSCRHHRHLLFLCRPALETRYLPPAEAAQVVLPALQPSPSINWNLVRTTDESDSLESNTTPRERYESIT
jgi:hypothetical protein